MRLSSLFVASLVCGLSGTAMSQTEPPGTTLLPGVVVGAPRHLARPHKPEPLAVARSPVSLRTNVASAGDAPPVYGRDILATTTGNCSTTTWPTVSPVQCIKPYAHNYVECTQMVAQHGASLSDGWWWCTNQGFRN
jgi:hypothetical protein